MAVSLWLYAIGENNIARKRRGKCKVIGKEDGFIGIKQKYILS